MSVLIKGMGMPERDRVTIQISSSGSVYTVTDCKIIAEKYEHEAIEVHDDHGRLIDANALFEEIYKAWDITADASDCNVLMQLINDAPTIIPADKEEA